MPDACTIKRLAVTADGAGGQTESWSTATNVACRLAPLTGGDERIMADKLTAVSPYMVTMPAGTDIRPADRLVIGGRTFEVAAVLAGGGWETARRVAVVEIQ